jgi:hypothetical protein
MKEGEDKVKTIQANMQRKMEADEALQSKTDLKMTAQGAGLGLGLMLVGAALSATGIGAPIGVPMMAAGAAGGAAIGYGTSKLLPNKYEYETPQVNQMSNTSGNTNSDIMLKSILNMKQNPTPIYLDNTKLNSATAMGSYELNKGTTGSGR